MQQQQQQQQQQQGLAKSPLHNAPDVAPDISASTSSTADEVDATTNDHGASEYSPKPNSMNGNDEAATNTANDFSAKPKAMNGNDDAATILLSLLGPKEE